LKKNILLIIIAIQITILANFLIFLYDNIYIDNATYYSQENCKVLYKFPTAYEIKDIGIQQTTIAINDCDNKTFNTDSLIQDLTQSALYAYKVPVTSNLRQFYKSNYFFYYNGKSIKELTEIIENYSFIFNSTPAHYSFNLSIIDTDIKHNIIKNMPTKIIDKKFNQTLDEVQTEILITFRIKPNDDLEISYKYNNSPQHKKDFIYPLMKTMVNKSSAINLK